MVPTAHPVPSAWWEHQSEGGGDGGRGDGGGGRGGSDVRSLSSVHHALMSF